VKHLIDQPVRVRTTVDLPRELLDRSKEVVDRGLAKNQNMLFTAALADYLDQLDQQAIDRQFASMEADTIYRELNQQLLQEFAGNDTQASAMRDESP
jgi:metal-responsive CopG/Arc/MetJ family transcriptional regulator